MAAQNPGTFLGYVADGANQVRVAYSVDTLGQYHLWTRATERDAWRDLQTFPVEDKITPLRFHPDGHRIYLLSNHGSDLMRLVLKDVVTGAEMEIDQDPLGEADIDAAIFDPANGELLATRYIGDTVRWYPKTITTWRLVAAARLTGRSLSEIGDGSRNGAKWTFRVESPTDPARSSASMRRAAARRCCSSCSPISGARPSRAPCRSSSTAATDSRSMDISHSRQASRRARCLCSSTCMVDRGAAMCPASIPRPAAREPRVRGAAGELPRVHRLWEEVRARGAPEFGRAMLNDCWTSHWAVAAGAVNYKRIAITGGSSGGYAALAASRSRRTRSSAPRNSRGRAISSRSWSRSRRHGRPPAAPLEPMAGDPHRTDDSAMLVSRSPIHHVDSARVPLLNFQGVNDPRVTQAQSDRIALALHARGVPVTYLLASNTGHNFGGAATSLAVNRATEIFFAQCLGGRVEAGVDSAITNTIAMLTVNLDSLASNKGASGLSTAVTARLATELWYGNA